jgi:hypothetical protein
MALLQAAPISVAALIALVVSAMALVFNSIQTRNAIKALSMTQTLARGNAVFHFTNRYFDLVRDGDPAQMLDDAKWSYQYWSLHATEFYFFHHGMLPSFMYSLWMFELAGVYRSKQHTREAHSEHLRIFSAGYPEMVEFFNDLYDTARRCEDDILRNREVAKLVGTWAAKSKTITIR